MQIKKTRNLIKILVVIVAIVIIGVGLILTYNIWGIHPASTPNTAGNRVLINGAVIIDSNFYYIQFIIPDHASNIHVTGNYSVRDNSMIRLYLMDQNAFGAWDTQSSSFSANFDSGVSKIGNVNATLSSSGIYYVLFENPVQSKTPVVDIELNLSYWQT